MDGDWAMIVTVAAGLSLAGVIGLAVLTGLGFQRESRSLIALRASEAETPEPPPHRRAEIEEAERRLAHLHEELAWLERSRSDAEHQRESQI